MEDAEGDVRRLFGCQKEREFKDPSGAAALQKRINFPETHLIEGFPTDFD